MQCSCSPNDNSRTCSFIFIFSRTLARCRQSDFLKPNSVTLSRSQTVAFSELKLKLHFGKFTAKAKRSQFFWLIVYVQYEYFVHVLIFRAKGPDIRLLLDECHCSDTWTWFLSTAVGCSINGCLPPVPCGPPSVIYATQGFPNRNVGCHASSTAPPPTNNTCQNIRKWTIAYVSAVLQKRNASVNKRDRNARKKFNETHKNNVRKRMHLSTFACW